MGGASSFYAMLCICGFLSASWAATKFSKLLGISSIVLEITTGVLLGPRVLGLIDEEYAQCGHHRLEDCMTPDDLYQRIAQHQPLGPAMGRIANMEYCDLHAYLVKEGRSDLLGHDNWHSGINHVDPCGDGAGHPGENSAGIDCEDGHHVNAPHGAVPLVATSTSPSTSMALQSSPTVRTTTTALQPTSTAPTTMSTTASAATTTTAVTAAAAALPAGPGGADQEMTSSTHIATEAGHSLDATTTAAIAVSAGSSSGHPSTGNTVADPGGSRRLSSGSDHAEYSTYRECLEKSCQADLSHDCGLTPDVFTLIGHAGVALMIFESGMHFDFQKAQQVGFWACVVAVVGTFLPLATGAALVMAYGKPLVPDGLSAGTALAPTSVGISLRLLGEAGVLQESFGQAIITAAFADDILSLILFNNIFSLAGEFDVITNVVFPVVGIVFMLACMVAAVKFWPGVINNTLMPMFPDTRDELATGINRMRLVKDEVLFLLMIAILVVYAFATHLLGTHLWGCFMAGMSFACLKPAGHAHHVWVRQTKRVTTWMIRIFFACTVAFSIPVADLLSINAFWKGTIMGIGPCIATKVSCAFFMGPPRFVIGWAMVGRAEFAYLIAQMAVAANMIDKETFSICIWALLYATIFAPFVFRFLLNRYIREYGLTKKVMDAEVGFEEHGGTRIEEKGLKKDYSAAEDRLCDLDAISFNLEESKEGQCRERQVREMENDPAFDLPAKSLAKPGVSDTAWKEKRVGNELFPSAGARGRNFLCCVFFKRIIDV